MTERKTTPAAGRSKKDKAVPKSQAHEPAKGPVPNLDNDDRDSRGATSHAKDASRSTGRAPAATSTGAGSSVKGARLATLPALRPRQ